MCKAHMCDNLAWGLYCCFLTFLVLLFGGFCCYFLGLYGWSLGFLLLFLRVSLIVSCSF